MKKLIYISLFLSVALWQCTPKTTDAAKGTVDKVETVVEKVKTFRSMPPEPGPAPKIELGTYESFTLENGLEVIVVENHKIPRISYQLSFDMPLISEGDAAGLRSMTGDLLSSGTTSKTKAELDEAIDFMGARLNVSSRGIFASSLKKHSSNLLDLMTDVLFNPSFSEKEFDRIKKQTLSGLATEKDNANSISRNVSAVLNYGKDHPYGELETEESINNITVQHCKDYYNGFFKPNIAHLIIVGDVTPAEAKAIANKSFANWKPANNLDRETFKIPTAPKTPKVACVNKAGAVQSVISVTYPVDMKPGSPDAIKARLMNNMYGGFFGSYLNQNLREDKAYTYGARSSLRSDKHIGRFSAGASVRNEVTDSALVQLILEMDNIRNKKLTDDDLSLVKNHLTGEFARSLENPQTIARFALNTARYNLPADYYQTYLEKVDAVTKEDIMAMAKKYITPENAHIVVVGNKDEIADKLTQFSPNGVVDFYDNYGTKLEIEDIAVPSDMTAQKVVEDYINAIGGADKLNNVKDMSITMGATMQGMQLSMITVKSDGKILNEMVVEGMGSMQKQVFDGTKGATTQMGQSKPMTDKEMTEAKMSAIMFSELNYSKDYTLELKGIDDIEGVKAYKIIVESPSGSKTTEFYDMTTSLKIQEIKTEEMSGQTVTQITKLENYQEVDGIKIPHMVTVSGAMPAPLKMEMKDIKINSGVADSIFIVE